jgi:hypothetical protein
LVRPFCILFPVDHAAQCEVVRICRLVRRDQP